MNYCLIVENGYILGFCRSENSVVDAVTKEEFDAAMKRYINTPTATEGYAYRLRADNLEWELVELPPAPEYEPTVEDKAEAYDILIGGVPDA